MHELGYTKCVFLDADMAVFRNPDKLFEIELQDKHHIAANHACVCNLDHDSWAPPEWQKGNCAYTTLTNPEQTAETITPDSRPTYHLLNSGMFVYEPNPQLWGDMLNFFLTTEKLKDFQFPDQDFLVEYFRGRWQPVSWKFNALKTMRYWHPRMWSDDTVTVLHYIVDKPWERKVKEDGIAGHLGRDGDTHSWWWDLYIEWCEVCDQEVLDYVSSLVDKEQPITSKVPLPQEPGLLEDVIP